MVRVAARRLYFVIALSLSGLGTLLVPSPAAAQKMSEDGFTLPWFHSRGEKLARQACIDDLPECRDSVRKQIATEKMITRSRRGCSSAWSSWARRDGPACATRAVARERKNSSVITCARAYEKQRRRFAMTTMATPVPVMMSSTTASAWARAARRSSTATASRSARNRRAGPASRAPSK